MEMDALTLLNVTLALFNVIIISIIVFIAATTKRARSLRVRTRRMETEPETERLVNNNRDQNSDGCTNDLCF